MNAISYANSLGSSSGLFYYTPWMKGGGEHFQGQGRLFGKFELSPKRRPIWAWLELYLTPKRYILE